MKTLKLASIVIVLFLITVTTVQAQVSINVNIGKNPSWGLPGYSGIRYYYLPDVEAYYDIQAARFIYYERGLWVHRTYLPSRYRHYDLKRGYKVVIKDYRGDNPYIHHDEFRRTYVRGYHGNEREYYFNKPGRGNDRRDDYRNNRPVQRVESRDNHSVQRIERKDDRRDNRYNDRKDDRRDNNKNDRKDNRRDDNGRENR